MPDFAEGFEFTYGACQFMGSLIQFFEQSHVLNCNDGLGGEGFKQLDLVVGERTNFRSPYIYQTDRLSFPKHWNTEKCSGACPNHEFPAVRILIHFGGQIVNMDWPALEECLGAGSFLAVGHIFRCRMSAKRRNQSCAIPLDQAYLRVTRPTETRRSRCNGLQDWLDVRRRAGDNAQDLTRRGLLV